MTTDPRGGRLACALSASADPDTLANAVDALITDQFAASTRAKRWGKCPSTNTAAANDPCCWQQSGNWRTQLVWGARGATRD